MVTSLHIIMGESDLEVQNRMVQTLTELMEKEDHQNILAVSHGGACTMFRKKWTGILGNTRNCSILVFGYDEEIKKTLAFKWTLASKLIMNNRPMVFSFILLFYKNKGGVTT